MHESISFSVLDLEKQHEVAAKQMTDAGGRTSTDAGLKKGKLTPFGYSVAAVVLVSCLRSCIAFCNSRQQLIARYTGCFEKESSPFQPQYKINEESRMPENESERAVLSHVTGFPEPSQNGPAPYRILQTHRVPGGPPVRIQRVFHGVRDLDAAVSIITGGFAPLRKIDGGWYGARFYFTPDLDYALKYARSFPLDNEHPLPKCLSHLSVTPGRYRVVLASDVMYASPMPVLNMEFYGQPLAPGHDAHVAVVKMPSESNEEAVPLDPRDWSSTRTAAEVVIDCSSCVKVRSILLFKVDEGTSSSSSSSSSNSSSSSSPASVACSSSNSQGLSSDGGACVEGDASGDAEGQPRTQRAQQL